MNQLKLIPFTLLLVAMLFVSGCKTETDDSSDSNVTYPDLTERPECPKSEETLTTEDFHCGLLQDVYDDRFGRVLSDQEIDQMAEAMAGIYSIMRSLDAEEDALDQGQPYKEPEPPLMLFKHDGVCKDIVEKSCSDLMFEPRASQEAVDKIREGLEERTRNEPGGFFN